MLRIVTGLTLLSLASITSAREGPVPQRVEYAPTFQKGPGDRCASGAGVADAEKATVPRAQRLGHLPPASQLLAVYHKVDGRPEPIVLRDGIGGNPQKAMPLVRHAPRYRTLRH